MPEYRILLHSVLSRQRRLCFLTFENKVWPCQQKTLWKRKSLSGSGKALVKMEELLWKNISVLKMERPLRQSLCERRKVFVKKTNDFWKGKWSRRKAFGRKVWFHFYYMVFSVSPAKRAALSELLPRVGVGGQNKSNPPTSHGMRIDMWGAGWHLTILLRLWRFCPSTVP